MHDASGRAETSLETTCSKHGTVLASLGDGGDSNSAARAGDTLPIPVHQSQPPSGSRYPHGSVNKPMDRGASGRETEAEHEDETKDRQQAPLKTSEEELNTKIKKK